MAAPLADGSRPRGRGTGKAPRPAHAFVLAIGSVTPLEIQAARGLCLDAGLVLQPEGGHPPWPAADGAEPLAALILLAAGDAEPPEALAFVTGARAQGVPILGVGAAAAWLCEHGLLPGRLVRRPDVVTCTHARVEGRLCAFTGALPAGRILSLAGSASSWQLDPATAPALHAAGQIVLRACDAHGGLTDPLVAPTAMAVTDAGGGVVGLLAAPPLGACDLSQLLSAARLWRPVGALG